eukprot:ANDGO_00043.mRNA.1 hypothetical protein
MLEEANTHFKTRVPSEKTVDQLGVIVQDGANDESQAVRILRELEASDAELRKEQMQSMLQSIKYANKVRKIRQEMALLDPSSTEYQNLRRMEEHHRLALSKWEEKKQMIIKERQKNLEKVLDALRRLVGDNGSVTMKNLVLLVQNRIDAFHSEQLINAEFEASKYVDFGTASPQKLPAVDGHGFSLRRSPRPPRSQDPAVAPSPANIALKRTTTVGSQMDRSRLPNL